MQIILGVLIALVSPPAAQQAGYSYIAQPNGTATKLTALTLPKLGTTFKLQVPTGWFSGNSHSQQGNSVVAHRVEQPRARFPRFGIFGVLYRSMEIVTPLPTAWSAPTLIVIDYFRPNDARLLGVTVYQHLVFSNFDECRVPSTSVRLSRGGCGVVGH